jgi:hypothetical protein
VHRFTRWAIFFILLYRMVPTLIWFGYPSDYLFPEGTNNMALNPANLKANYTAGMKLGGDLNNLGAAAR